MKKIISLSLVAAMVISTTVAGINGATAAKKATLKTKSLTITVGQKKTIKIANKAKKGKYTFASSKKAVAAVSKKGVVSGKKAGTAKITVKETIGKKVRKLGKVSVKVDTKKTEVTEIPAPVATVAPTITPTIPGCGVETIPPVNITSIEVTSSEMTVMMGDTFKLPVKIEPSDASLKDCKVTFVNPQVASVAENGMIRADYIGNTYVKIEALSNPEISAELKIYVSDDFTVPQGFDVRNPGVEKGNLTDFNYPSSYRDGGKGHALIWYPPGYDESKEYNLLLCLHGGSDTEYYWTGDKGGSNDGCKGDIVLDNLYANGLMEDAIVIFPHGIINYNSGKSYPDIEPNPFLTDFWKNHYLLEFEVVKDLLPYARENLNVYKDKEHTAICGLSMGCAQTMELGFKHPDLFNYIGPFSAGPFEDMDQFFVNSKEDAQNINEQLKLIFFITGENDHLHEDSLRKFVGVCNENDLNNVFFEVKGVGHDDYCWDKALYTFMKYAFK